MFLIVGHFLIWDEFFFDDVSLRRKIFMLGASAILGAVALFPLGGIGGSILGFFLVPLVVIPILIGATLVIGIWVASVPSEVWVLIGFGILAIIAIFVIVILALLFWKVGL